MAVANSTVFTSRVTGMSFTNDIMEHLLVKQMYDDATGNILSNAKIIYSVGVRKSLDKIFSELNY